MRAALPSLVVLAAACGGAQRPPPPAALADGARVRIVDGGQVFDALDTTTCVRWPSDEVRRKAGRAAWGAFVPDTGLEGTVLATLAHCDGRTRVVLVAAGQWVVPVTSRGVEAADDAGGAGYALLGLLGGGGYGGVLGGVAYGGEEGMLGVLTGDEVTYDDGEEGAWEPGEEGGGAPDDLLGRTVAIVDAGEIYSTINELDCLAWPDEDTRQRGGIGGWGAFYPGAGDVGVVVGVTTHCDSGAVVVLVDVEGHVVPVRLEGVAPT